jgi:lipase chaperone LimK
MLYPFSLNSLHSKILSIAALILLLCFVAFEHIRLHDNPQPKHQTSVNNWHQPTQLNALYPQLISDRNWQLDFIKIESVINNLEINDKHEILINSDTADKLQLIIPLLGENPSNKEWGRLEFLIIQSLGKKNGQQFYTLVNGYFNYQKNQIAYLDEIKYAEPNDKLALLKNSASYYAKIQSQYFGKTTAQQLFDRKNKTTNYLNSRRIVSMEKGLSKTQKKEQLTRLAKNYKQSISQQ